MRDDGRRRFPERTFIARPTGRAEHRGENEQKVREWLKVGANVKGVIGFAVGRTVFWEPLKAFRENRMTRDQAAEKIAETYSGLCNLWIQERS